MSYVQATEATPLPGGAAVLLWHAVEGQRGPDGLSPAVGTRCGVTVSAPRSFIDEDMTLADWEVRFGDDVDLCECALPEEAGAEMAPAPALTVNDGYVPPGLEDVGALAVWDTRSHMDSAVHVAGGAQDAKDSFEWVKAALPAELHERVYRIEFRESPDGRKLATVFRYAVNEHGNRYAADGKLIAVEEPVTLSVSEFPAPRLIGGEP